MKEPGNVSIVISFVFSRQQVTLLNLWVMYEKSQGQIESSFIVAFTSHAFLNKLQ